MHRYKPVKHRFSDALTRLSWQDFERLVAAYYAGQGYRVEHVGTGESGTQFDGGIDLKLYRADQYLIVQCKHWNAAQVTHNAVHELLGVMLTERATGAVVVTSGEFTSAAREAADKATHIQLVDGAAFRQMAGPLIATFAPNQQDDANFGEPGISARTSSSSASYRTRRVRHSRKRNPLPGVAFAIIAGLVALYVVRHAMTNYARNIAPSPTSVTAPVLPIVQASPPAAPSPPMQAPSFQPGVPTTDAEVQEWKRKHAESMKIIEKTTREMPLR